MLIDDVRSGEKFILDREQETPREICVAIGQMIEVSTPWTGKVRFNAQTIRGGFFFGSFIYIPRGTRVINLSQEMLF